MTKKYIVEPCIFCEKIPIVYRWGVVMCTNIKCPFNPKSFYGTIFDDEIDYIQQAINNWNTVMQDTIARIRS